jgi:hypothetical protein
MKVQYNSLTMLLIKSLLFKHLIGKISDTKFVTFRCHHNTIIKTKGPITWSIFNPGVELSPGLKMLSCNRFNPGLKLS